MRLLKLVFSITILFLGIFTLWLVYSYGRLNGLQESLDLMKKEGLRLADNESDKISDGGSGDRGGWGVIPVCNLEFGSDQQIK